ncbi:MAG: AMP-binding protein [Candidatus Tectomicrobia bacterium]|nr:AMP-binding protein [Candidatus Tectomicrobia bacterium]
MVMTEPNGHAVLSLPQLLAISIAHCPESVALTAAGERPLNYGRLGHHLANMARALCALGIGRHDCVALALPPGPELAVAFLAVASVAICAPLDPTCQAEEGDAYLTDLNAKALILPAGAETAVYSAARTRGIPILKLAPVRGVEMGLFALSGHTRFTPVTQTAAQPDDVALVLYTSGRIWRQVRLTHAHLCHTARRIAADLGLGPHHDPLNPMALPYIERFIEGCLASLAVGASVVYAPQDETSQNYTWLSECRSAWSPCVPMPAAAPVPAVV